MASSRQEYFILRTDVPIARTNNFLKNWLLTLNADGVLRGELLVKEALPHDGSHSMYSLAWDRSKKVSCKSSDVAPLDENGYEWLVAIQKPIDRHQVYTQQDKFEAIKKLQLGDEVWVSLPTSEGTQYLRSGASCCHATVQYIGPLQGMPGRYAGVELKEKRGGCDGSFRDSRYFICEDGHGAFLSANNILTVSHSTSASSMPTMPSKKLLLSCEKTKSGRNFYEDDQVVVFDKYGRRVPGVAKWACPGKEYGVDDYIIGIETDMPIKKEKVEEHIRNFGHFFSKQDFKKHSYLAVPEVSVMKEGEGTPVDRCPEAMDVNNPPDVTKSVRAAASTIAKNTRSTTAEVLSAQAKGFQEVEAKKVEAANKELADTLGLKPEELKAQREEYRKLERQQSENDQRHEPYPSVMGMGTHGQDQEKFASSQGDKVIQESRRSPGRHAPTFERQGSQERQEAKPILPRPVSHNLEVGTAVELVDPPGYGTIRWIGKFPGVDQDIAGVELDKKMDGCGDGSWDNKRYFSCEDGHALFIVLGRLMPDRRRRKGHTSGGKPTVQTLQEDLATVKKQLVRCQEALQAKNQQNEELQQMINDLWAIPATELEVTETVLGKGAYGEVRVGVYHGDRVAVKRLHNVIASDYYHKMIQREMGIAARLRHPKLVLFIGAVTKGNLTIVTELMETSLRSELEHGRLMEVHILPISRDVACALCYLHSLPEPIIHRDVSSANVLLNSRQGGWTAKLGDYGSANFQAKLQTVGPGCPVYAAPEASRPEEQGPKMDVYSYGVLVLEMCTGTLPDPRDLPVIHQAVHSWRQPKRQLGELACHCTLKSSDGRPHMRTVVTQLDGM